MSRPPVRYNDEVKLLLLATAVLLGSCGTTPLSQQLKDACDAHRCPADPPEYIDCMPIVAPEWQPVCETSCREFLAQTCKIPFVE